MMRLLLLTLCALLFIGPVNHSMAQQNRQMVRLAKIKIDPKQIDAYNAALKEQMATAVRLEPGVISYYAVSDKNAAENVTILEVYADVKAYESHIKTPHFLKYKKTVEKMVKSLELVDVDLIGKAIQPGK